jgi:hypothetical protein
VTTYRNQENKFVYRVFGVGYVSIAALVIAIRPATDGFIVLLISVVIGVLLFRFAKAAAISTDDGVTVRGTLRSISVPWVEIRRFRAKRRGLFPLIGVLERSNAKDVPIYALQAPTWFPTEKQRDPSSCPRAQP